MKPLNYSMALMLLTGCAGGAYGEFDSPSAPTDNIGTTTDSTIVQQLRVDVFPGETLDTNGQIRALPVTVGPFEVTAVLGQIAVSLAPPGVLHGVVLGESVTPTGQGASLPAVADVVAASVLVSRPLSIQNYAVQTNAFGEYETAIVAPEDDYLLAIVPDDAMIPFETREVRVNSTGGLQDFDLGAGVALYGQVTSAGAPVANAKVHITDSYGTASQSVLTDDDGWYQTRVLEDRSYRVISSGRSSGRDPVIDSSPLTVTADGARFDIDYPSLVGSFAFGRVVDAQGQGLAGVTARFVAKSLDGYEALSASLQVEDITDANGNFEARLINGQYRVEFLPPEAADPTADHASIALTEGTVVAGAADLGTVVLSNFVSVTGGVQDGAAGRPVSNARVVCSEVGFRGRSWSVFTDDSGEYQMDLPPTALSCQLIPPGDRLDLAWTTEQVDMSIDDGHIFEFRTGRRIEGSVVLQGEAESYALVEVRDGLGTLIGTTVTDESGSFGVQVDLPE